MATTAGTDALTEDVAAGDSGGPVSRRPRRWRRILLSAIGIVSVLTLLVGTVLATGRYLDDRSREAHRRSLVDAATVGVLALIDVHMDTVDADLARLRELSTGQFADELAEGQTGLVAALREAAVNSDGSIDSAGLARESDGTSVVIVAASARVVNTDSPVATPRTYRLRVTLDEVGGKTLMSRVEFVP